MEAWLALVVVALLASAPAGGANVFNAKNYGAKGNGVVDDTKVGSEPVRFLILFRAGRRL